MDFDLPLNKDNNEDFGMGDDPDRIEDEGCTQIDHCHWYNQVQADIHDLNKLCETQPASRDRVLQSIHTLKHELHSTVSYRINGCRSC